MNKITKDLVFNPVLRANEVKRYSGVRMQEEENLSQHIFEVSALSYMMASTLITNTNEDIKIGTLLEKALVHDFDEIITGDVQRNVKYASDAIKMSMDHVANDGIKRLANNYDGLSNIYPFWANAKKGKEGYLLKLADMLVVARKALIEVEVYNNYSALKVVTELVDHLKNLLSNLKSQKVFNDESIKILDEVVEDVTTEINNSFSKHNSIIEEYNLAATVIKNDPRLDK